MRSDCDVAVIGGGPAGLMAAEQLSTAGYSVVVYEAMPSVGRKFLRAGVGGLNLTHSENSADFIDRFGSKKAIVEKWLKRFSANDLRQWAADLGVETFIGSSGRVFPTEMKAAPLLRAWLKRLKSNGVSVHTRHRWLGWNTAGELLIEHQNNDVTTQITVNTKAVIFAMGGGSWARLGSDGAWLNHFTQRNVTCEPLLASNGGFNSAWSELFKAEFQGQALKSVVLSHDVRDGDRWRKMGDAMISKHGIEGGLVYAASAAIRDEITAQGHCDIYWDLLPDKSLEQLQQAIQRKRSKETLSSFLRKKFKLSGAKLALLNELTSKEQVRDLAQLPHLVKSLPQRLDSCRPIDEAISTAGGVSFTALNSDLMLNKMPGYFCAGEMLDWEAPTGGYLLTACFASGFVAGKATVDWLNQLTEKP